MKTETIYFYRTLLLLIQQANYVENQEQVLLNFLFDDMQYENKQLQEVEERKYAIK